MSKKDINVKLVRKVLGHIAEDINRLNMETFGTLKGSEDAQELNEMGELMNPNKWSSCGTKACMAGWTLLITTPMKQWSKLFDKNGSMKGSTWNKAKKLLGFTQDEADIVFSGDSLYQDTAREQFATLKKEINQVLEDRGMTERV